MQRTSAMFPYSKGPYILIIGKCSAVQTWGFSAGAGYVNTLTYLNSIKFMTKPVTFKAKSISSNIATGSQIHTGCCYFCSFSHVDLRQIHGSHIWIFSTVVLSQVWQQQEIVWSWRVFEGASQLECRGGTIHGALTLAVYITERLPPPFSCGLFCLSQNFLQREFS